MAHKVEYAGSFWEDLAKIAKREKKLENKVTKSERSGHQIADLEKHRKWKKRWKEFCKYDHDWDSTFLYEIIIRKISLMHEYFVKYSFICDEEKEEIIKSMDHVLEVGKRIMADEYSSEAHEFLGRASTGKVGHMIYYKEGEEDIVLFKAYDSPESSFFETYAKCIQELDRNTEKYKDLPVKICSFSEVSDEDHKVFSDMLSQAFKNQEKDILDFFTSIAQNIERWWD